MARATSKSARRSAERLREYARKRDFARTPEPAPGAIAPPSARPTFMVHKHDASRLHYDLRLEMAGALASFAVPKGPSYDPSVKRMALETEDHPLEYGRFEGRIPEGEYGAGDVIIWDRGTYDTVPPGQAQAQREKGHLHLLFDGEKLKGRWHLVRTGGRRGGAGATARWLLFKAKDAHADAGYDVVAARPESVVSGRVLTRGPERARVLRAVHPDPETLLARVFPPMQATLVDAPPGDEAAWLSEVKYDGFRVLCALSGGRVAMWSRNRQDFSGRFPEIARALGRIVVGEAVIDGEAVALDAAGVSRFESLQQGRETVLYAFDLLWLDGEDLRARPIEARRDLLESVLANPPASIRLAERLPGGPSEALEAAAAAGHEGIVMKRRGSPYEGWRSRAWLKLKVQNTQELAVVGFTPVKGERHGGAHAIGALLLGVVDGGELVYAGKVGTGFSAKQRAELGRALAGDVVAEPAVKGAPRLRDARWVTPRLVAQVRFTEWTADGKLRHPAFQGLRPDKTPEACVRERPAAAPRGKRRPRAKRANEEAEEAPPVVELTHPDRLIYPRDGLTKRDVAAYYDAVSEPLLRALAGRPLALEHWPKGIHAPGFFHQDLGRDRKPWMTIVETPASGARGRKVVRHLVADRPETLRWLAQRSALTLHTWASRAASLGMPDWVVFDLDPAPGRGFEQTVEVAHTLRRLLDELGVPSFPKTSGKRGLHVLVPLRPGHTHADALAFATAIGGAIARALPQVTIERAKAKRRGRLYLDCLQNGYGKTIVAPYSLRAADGAPVSAPLAWREVGAALDPAAFNLRTMPERLRTAGDLFEGVLTRGVRLPRLTALPSSA